MQKTDGSITSGEKGYIVEQTLFTYDKEEQEQNRINKTNAELILTPRFIPVYPILLQNGYGLMESVLFGFITFFLENTSNRFYCTNEQLANMFGCSEKTISTAIKNLESKGDITLHTKIKTGGGRTRFISLGHENVIFTLSKVKNLHGIYNNIYSKEYIYQQDDKKNTTTSSKKKKTTLTEEQEKVFEAIWKEYPRKKDKQKAKDHFLLHDADELMFEAKLQKRKIELEVIEKQYVRYGGRRMVEFTPMDDGEKYREVKDIYQKHMEMGGNMRERMEKLVSDFPNIDFNKMYTEWEQKKSLKNKMTFT